MTDEWRPTAQLSLLRYRAELLARIRTFMSQHDILEVDTPCLQRTAVSDPAIASIAVHLQLPQPHSQQRYWLHTSPEYDMKRLLAAGSGSIYQICKVFRDAELGSYHQPEFSLLEWYCVAMDHRQLLRQIQTLLAELGVVDIAMISYREQFLHWTGLDPHTATEAVLREQASRLTELPSYYGRREMLELLFMDALQQQGLLHRRCFIYDYPACMAALARINTSGDYPLAERFELFVDGVEIANGYHELADAAEQERRFCADQDFRNQAGLPETDQDTRLMAALLHGLPNCAGVAMGIERLLMVLTEKESLQQVQAFSIV